MTTPPVDVSFPAPLRELLDAPVTAVVSTSSSTGGPQSSVTWFERRDDEIAFFAEPETAKVRNLRRDPRIVLVVVDPERAHAPGVPAYVRLTGTARIEPGEPDFADRLARAYGNPDGYPWPIVPYVNVHITVTRISGLGPFATRDVGGWQPPTPRD
jgi:PPOX class probable F420-dependent enzyme